MNRKQQEELYLLLKEKERRQKQRKLWTYYPEEGPLRRELYVPHMRFFEAGAWARERSVIAANGIGKTESIGGYEMALHLTGQYPEWWEGRRFDNPISAWAVGDTNQTVRDILQVKLLGEFGYEGTGLVPGESIVQGSISKKAGVPDAIESILVEHVSGQKSKLGFKSYDQGRRSFQGTEKHVIWLDEECPELVYDECLMRTRTVDGMMMLTFTPMQGLTPVVLSFMPDGLLPKDNKVTDSKFIIQATWDNAPHLTEKEKEEIISGTLPHLRDARSKGIPQYGAGLIYPISQQDIEVDDFEIPINWPRIYGFDVGWNWTAAPWMAHDIQSDILYIYSVYKRSQAEPSVHKDSILARGDWIPGAIDPASAGSSQIDGKKLKNEYMNMGLTLYSAVNAVDAGLLRLWNRMTTGRLKVFKSCTQWFEEFRLYRRDEKGNIVKQNDHLMDGTRYGESMLDMAVEMPDMDYDEYYEDKQTAYAW